ncbi:hypothetical protein HU200_054416 [Digitaria exilis]|uniref:Phytosulfokine n=1 Tax=Digitaria exilis TaxID=1010633 RepID=A0A835AIK3_9POAL|nr:hypothetical protein HU200_054416 [Digitaria exilis]
MPAAAAVPPLLLHQGVKVQVLAANDGLVLDSTAAVGSSGHELSSVAEEADQEPACQDQEDDECMQRRLLRDAHLDYIYTQHKDNP